MDTVTITGTNRKGRELTCTLPIVFTKEQTKTHPIVRWTDGKTAALSGHKVWRVCNHRMTVLMQDITSII